MDRFLHTNTQRTAESNPVSHLLSQCKRSFILSAWLTLAIEVLSITPIVFMWNLFDRVISARSGVTLVSLGLLVLLAYGFWSGLEWVRTRLMIRISLRIDWDIASRVFDTSFRRYVARKDVDVHQVLDDVVKLRSFLTGNAVIALMSAPFAVVFMLIGWAFHPYLALFILVATLIQLMAAFSTSKITTPALREANNAAAAASRVAAQSLRQSNTAMALGMQGAIRNAWFTKHQRFLALQVNASESAGLVGGFTNYMSHALPSMQLALGAYLAIQGHITSGMVIAASFLLSRAIKPIQQIMGSWPNIQSARQSLERLNTLVAEDDEQAQRMPLPPPTGALQVNNLVIDVPGRRPVLDNLNFKLQPGQVLGVIGPTASGKTSLTRVLVGLWFPSSGHVRLDGAEVAPWIRDNLGGHIGYVPLEIHLFEGTIAENIARLGEVDPDKVIAAAQAVEIHDTILSFPKGYDTRVGETGHVLTGGQRQRIVIARALYNDPLYLVMDEPNASLDEAGEMALIRLLRKLKSKKTTVVFTTHRPRLLAAADFLMVLRDGQQAMYGPVAEILEKIKESKLKPAAPATTPATPKAAQAAELAAPAVPAAPAVVAAT